MHPVEGGYAPVSHTGTISGSPPWGKGYSMPPLHPLTDYDTSGRSHTLGPVHLPHQCRYFVIQPICELPFQRIRLLPCQPYFRAWDQREVGE